MMGKLKNKIKPSCAAWGETGLMSTNWVKKSLCPNPFLETGKTGKKNESFKDI